MEEDIKIYVSVFVKEVVTLNVKSYTTVQALMELIGYHWDGDGDYLLLSGQNDLLSDPAIPISIWGIKDQAQLILTRRGLFNVRVQEGFDSGSKPPGMIQLDTFDRVAEVKLKIQQELGIPVEKQLLFYCYSPMVEDDGIIASYGFFNPRENDEENDSDYCFIINVLTEPPCDRCHGASSCYHRPGCPFAASSAPDFYDMQTNSPVYSPQEASPDCTNSPVYSSQEASSDCTNSPVYSPQEAFPDCTIVVEIPASIGTIFLRLKVNLKDTISKVKTMIHTKAHSHDADSPLAFISEELFCLLFNRKVLKEEILTLEECGIKDQGKLALCPKGDYTVTVVVVLVEEPNEMQVHGVNVRFYDTVSALKRRIRRLVKISSKKRIILRFEGRRLDDDDGCLLEYGIVQYPHIPGQKSYYLHKRSTCIIEALTYGPLDDATSK